MGQFARKLCKTSNKKGLTRNTTGGNFPLRDKTLLSNIQKPTKKTMGEVICCLTKRESNTTTTTTTTTTNNNNNNNNNNNLN